MRTTEDYLDEAAKFHSLAALCSEPSLKSRYADLAECFRLLAAERRLLIEQGTLEADA